MVLALEGSLISAANIHADLVLFATPVLTASLVLNHLIAGAAK